MDIHRRDITHYSCPQSEFDNEYRRLGRENFDLKILAEIKRDSLKEYNSDIVELERHYIKKYKDKGFSLYNITDGGGYSWSIYNVTKKKYDKISDELREARRQKMIEYYSKNKPRDMSGEKNPGAKRVIGIDIQTKEIVDRYSYAKAMCSKFDIKYSTLKRKLNSKGGMIINGILYCYESDIDKEV